MKDEDEKEEISTPLNLSEIEEPNLDFLVETKTDGTASEVIKKKRKRELSEKQIQKRAEKRKAKKKKLEQKFIENEKKNGTN